ncbi:MarR family transcriptional regulator [Actinoplanes sp. NPDC089786]|uniref:MarR family transcriptional regulator n=1 Tax=Actinoplanes sp. NPDC089786 TaxID=3155185 RepID=UPI003416A166
MDNQKLSPSAKLTLDALNAGPGNVHELSDRTGRSRSTTDKAINDLAKAGLIVKVDDGGDPADGAPTRWQLAEAPADTEAGQPEPDGVDNVTEPDTDAPDTDPTDADAATQAEATNPAADLKPGAEPPATGDGDGTAPASEAPADGGDTSDGDGQPDTEATPDGEANTPDGDGKPDGEAKPDGGKPDGGKPDGDENKAAAEPPKLCRGCQTQMPKICECCWQKTPAYCGKCRKDMPQVRRGDPGEPVILANGLPKLLPGELEAMVEKVMREQPLPAFQGIVGWTGGRLAIHIPGRSPGAMTNAMRKFDKEGKAELIGDNPERYKLKVTEQQQPDGETGSNQETKPGTDDAPAQDTNADDAPAAEDTPADGAQPPADAEVPQPDATA